MCRASEAMQTQLNNATDDASIGHGTERVTSVHGVDANRVATESSKVSCEVSYCQDAKYESEKFDCNKCGYSHDPRSCPALGKTCIYCKEINHFVDRCPNKKLPSSCYRRRGQ